MVGSILVSTTRYLSGFMFSTPPTPPHSDHPDRSSLPADDEHKTPETPLRSGVALSQQKRKRSPGEAEANDSPASKRLLRRQDDAFPFSDDDTSTSKAALDRKLMPPPATPKTGANQIVGHASNTGTQNQATSSPYDDNAVSLVSNVPPNKQAEDLDESLLEEARRHAAAITLPPNSGIWSETERDLFYHLAYRGFEPLLPQNWMIDFDTLPLGLFETEESVVPALVHNIRDNQFRASHALRRLFETGHDVRDRGHVSPGLWQERILDQAVKRYLYWALTDVGLRPASRAEYLPVHMIATRRKGRSTLQTLQDMALKLHRLSDRHLRARNIRPSIEKHLVDPTRATQVIHDDDEAPTFIGLVIISSVLAIVTLNSFAPATPPPLPQPVRQTASPPFSDPDCPSSSPSDFAPDRLRIIAELDFSQKDQDVWNALAIAIVAMQIRKEALKANSDPVDQEGSIGTPWRSQAESSESLENLAMLHVDDPDL